MSYDPQKVISVALAEVGYHEKKTNEQLDEPKANAGDGNYTKYSRDLWRYKYFNGSKSGVEWCSVFVSWCFVTAYGLEAALKLLCQKLGSAAAGVKYAKQYFQQAGRYHAAPYVGDVIFFARGHVGIVYDVADGYVYTIEGNTSNQVLEHRYRMNDDSIDGYGRPDYGTEEEVQPMTATGYVTATSGNTVRLRKRPDDKAETLVKVPKGTVVTVNEQSSDGWSQIVLPDGEIGYMMSQFIKLLEYADEGQEQPSTGADEETIKQQLDRIEAKLDAVLGGAG